MPSAWFTLVASVNTVNQSVLLQLFKCFNKLGLCQSVSATRSNIDRIITKADDTLRGWRQQVEDYLCQV